MNKNIIRYVCLVLSLMIMTLIFIMSHQPAEVSTEQSGGVIEFVAKIIVSDYDELPDTNKQEIINNYQLFVRKAAHFSIYCLLAFLLSGFYTSFEKLNRARVYVVAFITTFAFSCSDEIHQYFIPGRSCQISDVLLDSSGAVVGIIMFILLTLLINKIRGGNLSEKRIK